MKRSPILLSALMLLGCDSQAVHENIIDNFVCVYMPWWMGDCQSPEVTDRVASILDNGMVAAQIDCIGSYQQYRYVYPDIPSQTVITGEYRYRVTKFQDGTLFVDWNAFGSQFLGFLARSNPRSPGVSMGDDPSYGATTADIDSGNLVITSYQTSYSVSHGIYIGFQENHETVVDLTTCGGFNQSLF